MPMVTTETTPLLFSSLADDPDMGELVDLFVDELSQRVTGLQAALSAGDWEALGRGAHQLKGAAGSYGFDALTPALKLLEEQVRTRPEPEALSPLVEQVAALCGRVRSGLPQ